MSPDNCGCPSFFICAPAVYFLKLWRVFFSWISALLSYLPSISDRTWQLGRPIIRLAPPVALCSLYVPTSLNFMDTFYCYKQNWKAMLLISAHPVVWHVLMPSSHRRLLHDETRRYELGITLGDTKSSWPVKSSDSRITHLRFRSKLPGLFPKNVSARQRKCQKKY